MSNFTQSILSNKVQFLIDNSFTTNSVVIGNVVNMYSMSRQEIFDKNASLPTKVTGNTANSISFRTQTVQKVNFYIKVKGYSVATPANLAVSLSLEGLGLANFPSTDNRGLPKVSVTPAEAAAAFAAVTDPFVNTVYQLSDEQIQGFSYQTTSTLQSDSAEIVPSVMSYYGSAIGRADAINGASNNANGEMVFAFSYINVGNNNPIAYLRPSIKVAGLANGDSYSVQLLAIKEYDIVL
jgi:hypothetical protein